MFKRFRRTAAASAAVLALGAGGAAWAASAASASASAAPTAVVPHCTYNNLAIWVYADGADTVSGTTTYHLEFTNLGRGPCSLTGFPAAPVRGRSASTSASTIRSTAGCRRSPVCRRSIRKRRRT